MAMSTDYANYRSSQNQALAELRVQHEAKSQHEQGNMARQAGLGTFGLGMGVGGQITRDGAERMAMAGRPRSKTVIVVDKEPFICELQRDTDTWLADIK